MKKLNNLFDDAKKLNELIKKSSLYLEYQKCLELKNNSQKLQKLETELKKEKELICLKSGNKKDTERYYQLKDEIDNYPLMVNYKNAYQKFSLYLEQIVQIINQEL